MTATFFVSSHRFVSYMLCHLQVLLCQYSKCTHAYILFYVNRKKVEMIQQQILSFAPIFRLERKLPCIPKLSFVGVTDSFTRQANSFSKLQVCFEHGL